MIVVMVLVLGLLLSLTVAVVAVTVGGVGVMEVVVGVVARVVTVGVVALVVVMVVGMGVLVVVDGRTTRYTFRAVLFESGSLQNLLYTLQRFWFFQKVIATHSITSAHICWHCSTLSASTCDKFGTSSTSSVLHLFFEIGRAHV